MSKLAGESSSSASMSMVRQASLSEAAVCCWMIDIVAVVGRGRSNAFGLGRLSAGSVDVEVVVGWRVSASWSELGLLAVD